MRIGIAATRLAGVDGVTFETVKWEIVLEELGHEMRLVAGDVDALRPNTRLIFLTDSIGPIAPGSAVRTAPVLAWPSSSPSLRRMAVQ